MYLKVIMKSGKPHINLMGNNHEIVLSGEVRSSFSGAVKTAHKIVGDPPTYVMLPPKKGQKLKSDSVSVSAVTAKGKRKGKVK